MIRRATASDWAQVEGLLREAHAASIHHGIEPDPVAARTTFNNLVAAPNGFMWVAVSDTQIIGVMAGILTPGWWFHGDVATDVFFYVSPNHRGVGVRLLRKFIAWARGFKSVSEIVLHTSIGGEQAERTEQLYSRMGFRKSGGLFVVEEIG